MAYRTEGKNRLISFFREHPDEQFTADEICVSLNESGDSKGLSSVYRRLSVLCRDNVLQRFSADGSFVYQYMGAGDCAHHFHLKCMSCGEILHLDCSLSDELLRHLEAEHGFSVDSGRSILFGVCKKCKTAGTAACAEEGNGGETR